MTHRVVVTMFTDDTTVYLMEKDDFAALNCTLSCWCRASGAKFNTTKTEVIPIGSREYHNKVVETRKINNSQEALPTSIDIARDGKAIRILGVWIGNGIEEQAIWSPILEKIENTLQRWEKWKIILQRTIDSMTQYLTTAQGMPRDIEDLLIKRTRKFIWDSEGKNSVSMGTLYAPISEGGKNILHLKSRNEAMELKWLKSLLAPPKECPQWTFFAYSLIAKAMQPSPVVKPQAHISPFIQMWSPLIKKLPTHLSRMVKAGKKYNMRWEAISINADVARQLPAWFHIGACIYPKWHPRTCTIEYALAIAPEQIPPEINAEGQQKFGIFDTIFPSPASIEDGY
ncbi:hypothetical protein DEU56DRAFT_872232 [Suillus clintonianus]|uniref:uncharacterized protein n=1 Tax=Suillus clintonianus TaxID=1904413 RepID=UPI001B88731F|nr:uncharacterized protein DEU56DRAFT_872232 [Suillus clintonianus]KAG2131065.1 hypothetical protein DEU56DRAFT_872232 [Suillus clintonianus]